MGGGSASPMQKGMRTAPEPSREAGTDGTVVGRPSQIHSALFLREQKFELCQIAKPRRTDGFKSKPPKSQQCGAARTSVASSDLTADTSAGRGSTENDFRPKAHGSANASNGIYNDVGVLGGWGHARAEFIEGTNLVSHPWHNSFAT